MFIDEHIRPTNGKPKGKAKRSWQEIARQAEQEPDPVKMVELITELNYALLEQGCKKYA